MEETFTQMLLRFMAERKITRAGLYKDADIDRKLIYKILKQKDYQPKKGTAVRLALGLRLSLEETKALLEAALHRPEQRDSMGGEPCAEGPWAGGYIEQ